LVGKRITIAANSDLTFDQRMQRICQTLDQAGYQVFILGRRFLNSIELNHENYDQQRLSLWFQKGKLAYIELNFRIFFHLLFHTTDAFYSVDLDTLPACWFLAKLKNAKLIHDAHEFMEEVPEVYNRHFTKKIWRWIGQRFVPEVYLAFTTSRTIAIEPERIHHKNYFVVRNIAYLIENENKEVNLKDKGYWVFLGAVNQGRGIEEFLEILPYTNRKLVILGDGDRLEAIKKLVSDTSIAHLVDFRGKVKPAEARKIMQHAWAGINLLTDEGLSYRYSLANKFFDYVHAGIPQICIHFPEYKILMREFEVGVLSSLQKESLLAASRIISLPEKQNQFRQQTQLAKQVWNWQSESQILLRLIENIFKPD